MYVSLIKKKTVWDLNNTDSAAKYLQHKLLQKKKKKKKKRKNRKKDVLNMTPCFAD